MEAGEESRLGRYCVCVRVKLISSVYTSVTWEAQRVLSFVSSRWNWDSPTPTPAGECAPFVSWGKGTLACGGGVGGGWSNPDSGTYTGVL
jgi:hypothetical protein